MTATVEQIAEVLAAHRKASHRGGRGQWQIDCACGWSTGMVPIGRDDAMHRTHQAEQVAALGVGDGEVEWGVRWQTWATTDGGPHDQCKTREIAEHVARQDRHGTGLPGVVMYQRRGPWVEVTDEGGEGR